MNLEPRVVQIFREDLQFPFEGKPSVMTSPQHAKWGRSIEVDPFPAYSHDPAIVAARAPAVLKSFPIGYQTTFYVLPCEVPARTNGHANRDMIYGSSPCDCSDCRKANGGKPIGKVKDNWEPYVVLSAKRIPPHPAMTRYLVAHEYGHIVQWWIEEKCGMKDESTTELDRSYMKLRPGCNNEYGGGRWHSNVGELFANDFRILMTGIEPEYWPHPGFPHPSEVPAVQKFWKTAFEDCAFRPAAE